MHTLTRQAVAYGVTGIAVSLLFSVVSAILIGVVGVTPASLGSALAFVLVLPISFLAQAQITFRHRRAGLAQFIRFGTLSISSFIISVGSMYVCVEILHFSFWLGIGVTWILIPAINFAANRFWVFRSPNSCDLPERPRRSIMP